MVTHKLVIPKHLEKKTLPATVQLKCTVLSSLEAVVDR